MSYWIGNYTCGIKWVRESNLFAGLLSHYFNNPMELNKFKGV